MPVLLVTAGPPGSGKTALVDKVRACLPQLGTKPAVHVLIDTLVESQRAYRATSARLLTGADAGRPGWLARTSRKRWNEAYRTGRSSSPCRAETPETCDELNDRLLYRAISAKQNVVFESAGLSSIDWLLHDPHLNRGQPRGYIVVIAYSLASLQTLRTRIDERATDDGRRFLADPSRSAPRVLDTGPAYAESVMRIETSLLDLFREYRNGTLPVDRLLVFNNNTHGLLTPVVDTDAFVPTTASLHRLVRSMLTDAVTRQSPGFSSPVSTPRRRR
jgi:hypothetical protein